MSFFVHWTPGWKPRKCNCWGIDKKMILKLVLKMRIIMIRTEFSLLMLGFSGELFECSDFSGSLKCVGWQTKHCSWRTLLHTPSKYLANSVMNVRHNCKISSVKYVGKQVLSYFVEDHTVFLLWSWSADWQYKPQWKFMF